jgi:hypothetical protein
VYHRRSPALQRLPPRSGLTRTLGSTRPAVVRLAARIRMACSVPPHRHLKVVSLVGARRDLTPHEPQHVEAAWVGKVNRSLGKWRTLKPSLVQASEPSPLQRRWLSVHSACALCKNYSSAAADLRGTARPLLLCVRLRAGAVRPKSSFMFASRSCLALCEARPRVNPMWSLTPRSTPTRYGRRCKPGLRYFVLCSQPRLTAPTSAGGVTSNVRPHNHRFLWRPRHHNHTR